MGDRRPNPPPSIDDDFIDHSEQIHIPNVIPPLPEVGDLQYDASSDQILVYDSVDENNSWKAVTPFQAPDWEMKYYVLRNTDGNISGIFSYPMDTNMPENFSLHIPSHETPFQPLTAEELTEADYGTHVAFGTFPILEVERDTMNGILLKFPD